MKNDDPLEASILTAVLDLIARDGFEGATFRRIATEAGCSAGAVQKRFSSRSLLLRSAFERVVRTALDRIATAESTGHGTLIERQRLAAVETLPLDSERRRETLVWFSYVLRAAVDEQLSDLPRQLDRAVHHALVRELADSRVARTARFEPEPDAVADALLALVDGIAIRMLYSPQAEQDACLAALDAGLDALLGK